MTCTYLFNFWSIPPGDDLSFGGCRVRNTPPLLPLIGGMALKIPVLLAASVAISLFSFPAWGSPCDTGQVGWCSSVTGEITAQISETAKLEVVNGLPELDQESNEAPRLTETAYVQGVGYLVNF